MPRYFAYGSNMNLGRLTARVGKVEVVGTATLTGYRHLFNKLGSDGTAKGNVEVEPSGMVWGVLYSVSYRQLEVLDAHEGGYNRLDIRVALSCGARFAAMTYRSRKTDPRLRPTPEYLQHYLVGAAQHELPEDYMRAILPPWYRRE